MINKNISIIGIQHDESGSVKAALTESGYSVNCLEAEALSTPHKISPDLCILFISSGNIEELSKVRQFIPALLCPLLAIVDEVNYPVMNFLQEMRVIRIFSRPVRIDELLLCIGLTLSEKENSVPLPDQCSMINFLLETVPTGICACRVDGKISFCNSSYEKITGYSRSELYNMHVWNLVAAGDQKEGLAGYLRFLEKEQPAPETFYTKFLTRQGKTIDVQMDWDYRRDNLDRVTGFICGVSDITLLKRNESRWMSLVRYTPEFITVVDRNGTILYVNHPDFRMPATEIVGQSMFDFIDDLQKAEVKNCLQQVLEYGNPMVYQSRFNFKEFKTTFLNKVGPVYEAGEISEMIIISIDVNERVKYLEDIQLSEERYRLLFDGSANPITIFDEQVRVLMINKAGAAGINRDPEEMIGTPVDEIFPENSQEIIDCIMEVLHSGIESTIENVIPFPDGERWFWSVVSRVPGLIKGKIAVQVISHEITDRKKHEDSLHQNLEEKELLIKEIHHRVKNNMQIISSILDLQYSKLVDFKDRELFLESQMRLRAMALVHEKMYMSTDISSVDLTEYINELITSYREIPWGNNPKITFSIEISEIALSLNESIPCALLLNELMSNAFKHAWPEGGRGELGIKIFQQGETIHLTVWDDGRGFDWDEAKKSGSIGVQLIIVLVEQLRGGISAGDNEGTCFNITFRETSPQECIRDEIMEIPVPDKEEKQSILIVEDERITALNFKRLLQRYGYFVPGIVTSAEEALRAIEMYKPDLVLMDIVIEGNKDGIDVARQINETSAVPVIYTTANNDSLVMEAALKTEPAGYITKPVDNIELLNLIHGTLKDAAAKNISR